MYQNAPTVQAIYLATLYLWRREKSSGKHSNGLKCGKPYSAVQLCDNWAHVVEGNCMNFATPLNPQKYRLEEIVSVLATSNYRSRFTRNQHHCCHAQRYAHLWGRNTHSFSSHQKEEWPCLRLCIGILD